MNLRSITSVPFICRLCDHKGTFGDCLPDDDGSPLCPKCASYDLAFDHLPHEITPTTQVHA